VIKNSKGISLISVLIMIIIIIIIASIAIFNGTRVLEDVKGTQKDQSLATVKAIVNEINLKMTTTSDVLIPFNIILYGKAASDLPDIANMISDESLSDWYILQKDDLEQMGINYANEIYAVNYAKNQVMVFPDYQGNNNK